MSKLFTPLTFDVKNPVLRSPMEEWAPHAKMSDKSFEWWYTTTIAYDASGNPYFIFFVIVNYTGDAQAKMFGIDVPDGQRVVGIIGLVSDYNQNKFYVPKVIGVMKDSEIWDAERNAVLCKAGDYTTSWSYQNDQMKITMTSPKITFDFNLSNANEVVFHKDRLGIEGFIQEGREDDFSFYYSMPRTPLTGTMSLTDESGKKRDIVVSGISWVDRQWGDFMTREWEWSSFRFNNGARVHLYSFFNGLQEGLYLSSDGKVQHFDNVVVKQNGYAKSPKVGTWVSYGWTYEFPIEIEGSKNYTVIPFSNLEWQEYPEKNFALYEGGGKLVNDETGEQVGVSVNESADVRQMGNEPYGKNQR